MRWNGKVGFSVRGSTKSYDVELISEVIEEPKPKQLYDTLEYQSQLKSEDRSSIDTQSDQLRRISLKDFDLRKRKRE